MYHCCRGDNLPSWEIFQKLSTYSSLEAGKRDPSFYIQICKAGLEVASSSSLKSWKKGWLSGCLQGEDNSACNFLSQSINSHCGGRRRKIGTLYMHFDVPRWDTILKAEFFQAASASFGPQLLLLFSHFAVPLWGLGHSSLGSSVFRPKAHSPFRHCTPRGFWTFSLPFSVDVCVCVDLEEE